MVQVLVEVRSGRWQEHMQYRLLECTTETGIAELKQRAEVEAAAGDDGKPSSKANSETQSNTGVGERAAEAGKAAPAGSAAAAKASSRPPVPARQPRPISELDLTFMGQICEEGKALRDYGVCHDWIAQVGGFVLHPKDHRR